MCPHGKNRPIEIKCLDCFNVLLEHNYRKGVLAGSDATLDVVRELIEKELTKFQGNNTEKSRLVYDVLIRLRTKTLTSKFYCEGDPCPFCDKGILEWDNPCEETGGLSVLRCNICYADATDIEKDEVNRDATRNQKSLL